MRILPALNRSIDTGDSITRVAVRVAATTTSSPSVAAGVSAISSASELPVTSTSFVSKPTDETIIVSGRDFAVEILKCPRGVGKRTFSRSFNCNRH